MKRVRISKSAIRDLDEIWLSLAVRSGNGTVADETVEAIESAFRLLSKHPLAGVGREEIRQGLRSFSVGKFLIYYRVGSSAVQVERILHGMRDPFRIL